MPTSPLPPIIIELHCTPDEYHELCRALDQIQRHRTYLPLNRTAFTSLIEKIGAINKRLTFASSIKD